MHGHMIMLALRAGPLDSTALYRRITDAGVQCSPGTFHVTIHRLVTRGDIGSTPHRLTRQGRRTIEEWLTIVENLI